MNDQQNQEVPAADARLSAIYARALPRMLRFMLMVSIPLLVPVWWRYSSPGAIGFALGALVSYINFRALARGVEGLTERIVSQQSREKGRKIVLRFLVRYALVGAVAYAIFKGSTLAFYGFLWGLCLPVAAMMIEAAFEAYAAFRGH
jgi:hypothetical protein